MGLQTRDARRVADDKSYIHELEHAEIHKPVQREVVIVLAVDGPSSKKNRTNDDGRVELFIEVDVAAAANNYRIAGRYCDTVTIKRIT